MKFLFRADASIQIGSGHIMRCLTLANRLRERGHSVRFIMREHAGHLRDTVLAQGFECVLLPAMMSPQVFDNLPHSAWLGTTQAQDIADCAPHIAEFAPDWIVCDHYALSADWERHATAINGTRLLAIDDLHDRAHIADIVLDQNLGHHIQDYQGLVPEHCRVLAGTRYALLRPEFAQWRTDSLAKRDTSPSHQRVFINLGGVDKDNITLKILTQFAKQSYHDLDVTVIMGATAPHIDSVRAFAETAPFSCKVLVNINNMAEHMAQADWAIGASGSTSWERCCLGLPSVMLVLADNQRTIAEQLQDVGASLALEMADVDTPKFAETIAQLRAQLAPISQRARQVCDGLGAMRVVQHIEDMAQFSDSASIRPAQVDDVRRVFEWRNHADIRRFMFQRDELIWENHAVWFAKQLHNPEFIMLIYQLNHIPQGYISFKKLDDGVWEWGFYTAPDCPRGNGTRMGRLALAWAFAELGAREVRGLVLADNVASLKLHEKLGFFRLPEKDNVVSFELFADKFLS